MHLCTMIFAFNCNVPTIRKINFECSPRKYVPSSKYISDDDENMKKKTNLIKN